MFYIRNCAEWKPYVWNSIKADYGLHSDDEDDYDDVDFTPKAIHTRSTTSTVQPGPSRTAYTQRTDEKLDHILAKSKAEEKRKSKEIFKCVISCKTILSLMSSCTTGCGVFLGCSTCLFNVESCPLCIENLPNVTERKPLLIPGLPRFLGVPEISLKSALKQLGGDSSQQHQ